jgi:hypothetical protein
MNSAPMCRDDVAGVAWFRFKGATMKIKIDFSLCSLALFLCILKGHAQTAPPTLPYLLFSPYQSGESLTYQDGTALEEIRRHDIDIQVTSPVAPANDLIGVHLLVQNDAATPLDVDPARFSAMASASGNRALDFMPPDRSAEELNQLGLSARAPLKATTLKPGESIEGWVYFRVPPGVKGKPSLGLLLVPGNQETLAFRWPWPDQPGPGDDPWKPSNVLSR